VDTGPDPEQDFEETGPETEHVPEQVLEETKPEAKGKMLMVHEPVKDIIDDKPEKNPRYEMRPRKSKLSIDLNRGSGPEARNSLAATGPGGVKSGRLSSAGGSSFASVASRSGASSSFIASKLFLFSRVASTE
jgi:hypothetical protein